MVCFCSVMKVAWVFVKPLDSTKTDFSKSESKSMEDDASQN